MWWLLGIAAAWTIIGIILWCVLSCADDPEEGP